MSKLTAEQILKIIEENYTIDDFAYNCWNTTKIELTPDQQGTIDDLKSKKEYHWDVEKYYILQNLGLGAVEEVEQYGGEDEGSTWYSVKYFKDHGIYIRIDGYYQSYNGTDFNEGYGKEVKPQEKTIIIYE